MGCLFIEFLELKKDGQKKLFFNFGSFSIFLVFVIKINLGNVKECNE